MKLELTLPALERLIGGDTEVEVALRYNIVEEFVKKHLKTILNDAAFKRMTSEFHKSLNVEIEKVINELKNSRQDYIDNGHIVNELKWGFDKVIREVVVDQINEITKSVIADQKRSIIHAIREAVKTELNINIKAMVAEGIKQRLAIASTIEDVSGLTHNV